MKNSNVFIYFSRSFEMTVSVRIAKPNQEARGRGLRLINPNYVPQPTRPYPPLRTRPYRPYLGTTLDRRAGSA